MRCIAKHYAQPCDYPVDVASMLSSASWNASITLRDVGNRCWMIANSVILSNLKFLKSSRFSHHASIAPCGP